MCLFVFLYYLCEKCYKPITVQYYIADCVSWVSRLTLLDLQKKLDLQTCSGNRTHSYVGGLLYSPCWQNISTDIRSYLTFSKPRYKRSIIRYIQIHKQRAHISHSKISAMSQVQQCKTHHLQKRLDSIGFLADETNQGTCLDGEIIFTSIYGKDT